MWAKNLSSKGSRKAFTLIEMAVSGVITAALAIGAMYWLYSNTDLRRVQASKEAIQFHHRDLMNRIKKDLNSGLKISGSTGECKSLPSIQCFPGFSRIDFQGTMLKPRSEGEVYDGVRILSNGGIAQKSYILTPSTNPVANVTTADSLFTQHPEGSDVYIFNKNLFRFINLTLAESESRLVFLSNAQVSHIGKIRLTTALEEDTKPLTIGFQKTGVEQIALSDLGRTQTNISPLFVVEWVVNPNTKQLIRRKRRGNTSSDPIVPQSEEIMAEGINEFKIDYTFSNHRTGSPTIDWPKENEFYSHIRDPRYLEIGQSFNTWSEYGGTITGLCDSGNPENQCCNDESRCITWQDVEGVRIKIEYEKKLNINSNYMVAVGDDFSVSNGIMNWESAALVFPENYSMQGKLTETSGVQIDCHLNPANRCGRDPSCPFEGEDPSQPDWKGFADPTSVYCICAGCKGADCRDDDFVPPETAEGRSRVPSVWDNSYSDTSFYEHISGEHILNGVPEPSRRALACLSYFDVAENQEWRNVHHLAYLIRICMPRPDIVRRPASAEEQNDRVLGYPLWIYHADNFSGSLSDGNPNGDGMAAYAAAMENWNSRPDSSITHDQYMNCDTFSYCDTPVLKQTLGRFRGVGSPWHGSDTPSDPGTWTPKPFRNYCGCLLEQRPGEGLRYDYNLRCNHNVRPENINGLTVRDWSGQEIDRPVCTTTWDPNAPGLQDRVVDYASQGIPGGHKRIQKVFKVRKSGGSPAHPQGLLNAEEALMCQCYAEGFEQNYQVDWNGDGSLEDYRTSPSENIPGSHGFTGQSYLVDFREAEDLSGCGFSNSSVSGAERIDSGHHEPGVVRTSPGGGSHDQNFSRLLSMRTMQVVALWSDGSVDGLGNPIINTTRGSCAPDQNSALPVARNRGSRSSSLAACTDSSETFANRSDLNAAQRTEYYAQMAGAYGESGTCQDRSSYCSPKCGQWTSAPNLEDLALTQARNFLINGIPQNDPRSKDRNLLPDFCGGPGEGSSSQ